MKDKKKKQQKTNKRSQPANYFRKNHPINKGSAHALVKAKNKSMRFEEKQEQHLRQSLNQNQLSQEEQPQQEEDIAIQGSEGQGESINNEEDHHWSSAERQEQQQMLVGQEQEVILDNERNLEQYQEELGNKGVIYMSRIPPFMTPNYIRKLLSHYEVQRIYLLPESQWSRKKRIKNGGSKRICFREGWIEFSDKKIAKMTALSLNGQKMVHKKGTFYSDDIWNLKYLPKFKWHHLTERLAHQQRLKKQRLRLQLDQERKVQQYYSTQVQKSKTLGGIIKKKEAKGNTLNKKERSFGQRSTLHEEQDIV